MIGQSMKPRSIARRVYRAILAVSVITTLAMVATVLLVNEDLEHTMLNVEFAQERDFILQNHAGDDVFIWDTPGFSVAFLPSGEAHPPALPKIFRGLPRHYAAEIELGDETYLVTVEPASNGVLYIAKNITHFEKREALFGIALIIMALIIVAFSLLLAILSSRRIIRPLRLLSERISRIPVGPSMPRMTVDYGDVELHSIARTFNRFLDELESFVRREQSLLSLASHELRTPIAVMSGALDVMELRDQLSDNDRATLRRIRQACDEMRDNVEILLKLARRDPGDPIRESIDVGAIAQKVLDDLAVGHKLEGRARLDMASTLLVEADPVMVGMLLRNLIQNAAQHTEHDIRLTICKDSIEIEDQGPGLAVEHQAILTGRKKLAADGGALSGLGLYIVTLMAERLGWRLDIAHTDKNGTKIRLGVNRSQDLLMKS